jgi:hypothetical protein
MARDPLSASSWGPDNDGRARPASSGADPLRMRSPASRVHRARSDDSPGLLASGASPPAQLNQSTWAVAVVIVVVVVVVVAVGGSGRGRGGGGSAARALRAREYAGALPLNVRQISSAIEPARPPDARLPFCQMMTR